MISNFIYMLLALFSLGCFSSKVNAEDKIFFVSTIPDLSWLASEIGGDLVETKSLLTGTQNPHFMDAVPNFVRFASRAQILCFVGLELEVGYLPPILSRSGNRDIQSGGRGFCDTSVYVDALDKQNHSVDRSMGDIHPAGNPHYYLSPSKMVDAAKKIKEVLAQVKPDKSNFFESNFETTKKKLLDLRNSIYSKFSDIHKFQNEHPSKFSVIEYHKEFGYYFKEYDIRSIGSLEAIAGVSPSLTRIHELAKQASKDGVWIGLNADYNRTKTTEKFSELTSIPFLSIATMVQPERGIKNYLVLQEKIAEDIRNIFYKRGLHGKSP